MQKTKKLFAIGSLLLIAGSFALTAFAQVNISTNIPGLPTNDTSPTAPCNTIFGFYNFALMIGGVLAFAAITYGGVKYTLAAGNPSGQSEGKDWVKGAIYGLLLLIGAYLILNVINPQITQCGLPQLQQVSVSTQIGTGPTGLPSSGCIGGTCSSLSASGFDCKDPASCSAAPAEVATLQCVQSKSGESLRITEGYPPTPGQAHISSCHQNGCCVDLTPPSGQSATCAQVQSIVQAAQQCGATAVANEWSSACGGTAAATTNGYNIHIQGC